MEMSLENSERFYPGGVSPARSPTESHMEGQASKNRRTPIMNIRDEITTIDEVPRFMETGS